MKVVYANVSQCDIHDMEICGLYIVDESRLSISKSTIHKCEFGLLAHNKGAGRPNVMVANCQVNDVVHTGIAIQGGDIICQDTEVSYCKKFGIAFFKDEKIFNDSLRGTGQFTNCDLISNYTTNISLLNCSAKFKDCRVHCSKEFVQNSINEEWMEPLSKAPLGVNVLEDCEIIMDKCVFDHPGIGAYFHSVKRSDKPILFKDCKFSQHETSVLLTSEAEVHNDLSLETPDLDSYGVFEGCVFTDFDHCAIQSMSRDPRFLVKNCDIYNGGEKIIEEQLGSGITFVGQYANGPKGSIEDSRFTNIMGAAIGIGVGADIAVCRCNINGADYGVAIGLLAECKVEDCEIQNIKHIGIVTNSDKACKFIGNKISNCGKSAWLLGPNATNLVKEKNGSPAECVGIN